MITLYDADNAQFPPGAAAYAAYVDGHGADQPNYDWVTAEFPGAHHLSIALFAVDDADALDVEPGAASASDVPGWEARQRARGVTRPCVYADVSDMRTQVLPVLAAASVARPTVRLWTAHYGAGEHICGPGSCGQLPVDADGTQWTSSALGRQLDQSLLADDFFGATAPPTQEVDVQVKLTVLQKGSSGQQVRNWQGLLVSHALGYMIAPDPATLPAGASVEDRAGTDGDFGTRTAAATAKFQAARNIPATGIVDGPTWAAGLG